nr:unnamed protein product [Callosobruchus analis]
MTSECSVCYNLHPKHVYRENSQTTSLWVCLESKQLATRASQNLQIPLTVKVVLQNTRYVGTDMSCRVNYKKTVVVDRVKHWCSTEVFLTTQVLRLGVNGIPL